MRIPSLWNERPGHESQNNAVLHSSCHLISASRLMWPEGLGRTHLYSYSNFPFIQAILVLDLTTILGLKESQIHCRAFFFPIFGERFGCNSTHVTKYCKWFSKEISRDPDKF